MTDDTQKPVARRAVVTALGTGALATLGVATSSREAAAQETTWRPTLEEQDEWMELPGRHRMVFDTISEAGVRQGLQFANNVIEENQNAYGLDPSQHAIIMIVRHSATVFGYDDAIWAKYSEALSRRSNLVDPDTDAAPTRNIFNGGGSGSEPGGRGGGGRTSLASLASKGVHFAVCGRATRGILGGIARQTNQSVDDLFEEFSAHLITNGHIVPAGIVAVNRTQERGYAFSYVG